jgi:hypothetical protein
LERLSDLLLNRRKHGVLVATGAMTDGLVAAALLQLVRMLAAASSKAAQSGLWATLAPWYSPYLQCTLSCPMACSVWLWWNAACTAQIVEKKWCQ